MTPLIASAIAFILVLAGALLGMRNDPAEIGALFLILEMDQPFAGIFQISTETLSNALAPLGN